MLTEHIKPTELVGEFGTPLYVYSEDELRENYKRVERAFPKARILYAVMCNDRRPVLEILYSLGSGTQISSLYELETVRRVGFPANRISFVSTGLNCKTLEELIRQNIHVYLDSIEEIEKLGKPTPNRKPRRTVGIRVNTSHLEVPCNATNCPRNIGVLEKDFEVAIRIAKQFSLQINGIHGYLASNILDETVFIKLSNYLKECAEYFENLEFINFGGGFGMVSKPDDKELNLERIGQHYNKLGNNLREYFGRKIELELEPGRRIMASAGILLTRVTNIKSERIVHVDAGFGVFARPKLYGPERGYHPIVVVEKNEENPTHVYDIRGNTVLQDDYIAFERSLPKVEEGDVLAVLNTGAYGAVMSSGFPGKQRAVEIMVYSGGRIKVI